MFLVLTSRVSSGEFQGQIQFSPIQRFSFLSEWFCGFSNGLEGPTLLVGLELPEDLGADAQEAI